MHKQQNLLELAPGLTVGPLKDRIRAAPLASTPSGSGPGHGGHPPPVSIGSRILKHEHACLKSVNMSGFLFELS